MYMQVAQGDAFSFKGTEALSKKKAKNEEGEIIFHYRDSVGLIREIKYLKSV